MISEAIIAWTNHLGGDIHEERVDGVLHYFFMRGGRKHGYIRATKAGNLSWELPKDLVKFKVQNDTKDKQYYKSNLRPKQLV